MKKAIKKVYTKPQFEKREKISTVVSAASSAIQNIQVSSIA